MQTIHLPTHLDELDLETLNQRLHANEIRLDWTDVEPNIPQPPWNDSSLA